MDKQLTLVKQIVRDMRKIRERAREQECEMWELQQSIAELRGMIAADAAAEPYVAGETFDVPREEPAE